jgi:hypothetical protein
MADVSDLLLEGLKDIQIQMRQNSTKLQELSSDVNQIKSKQDEHTRCILENKAELEHLTTFYNQGKGAFWAFVKIGGFAAGIMTVVIAIIKIFGIKFTLSW